MKAVTTYIAFDDTEFGNEEDCRSYEIDAFDTMVELDEIYHFYDENKNRLFISAITLEEMIDNCCAAYNECTYIEKMAQPSHKIIKFSRNILGIDLLIDEEEGIYKYNWNEGKWEGVY